VELTATVDDEHVISEYNETNNRLVQKYAPPQTAGGQGQSSASFAGLRQRRLSVS